MKNKVQLIGHLGANPEIRTLEGGNKLAKMSLATKEIFTNPKGEKITETQWHNVVAWGKTADVVEKYFTKGLHVMVDGKIISRTYDDKDGNKRYSIEVQANELLILSDKK